MLISILMPCKVFAVDISIGATTWYAWLEQQFSSNFIYENQKEKANPAFLYGPVLSAKFNDDFNLTFIFLYGKFDTKTNTGDVKMTRMDSDLALNYRLNDYLKIFAGVKYLGYEISDIDHSGAGPGLGLSATFPIIDNLFLLANLSGFNVWGRDEYSVSGKPYQTAYYEYGLNSTLSLAYYITTVSTIISLGGRFQYYNTVYDDDSSDVKTKFYGVTLMAVYSFSI